MKEKYHIEYVFDSVSKQSLWRHVSAPIGLSEWFAEKVEERDGTYRFVWGEQPPEVAHVLTIEEGERIRFRWEKEDDDKAYFEFIIHELEITGGRALEITDFAKPEDRGDAIELWDTLIERLQKSLGIN